LRRDAGSYAIEKRLVTQGVPARTRNRTGWRQSSVIGILRNPLYRGEAYYNRTMAVDAKRPHKSKGLKDYRLGNLRGRAERPRLAPFGPTGIPACTVKTGTKIFVVGASLECSTFERNGTTEAELRNCARQNDVQVAPTVSVDGKAVSVTEVETQLLHIVLPADNIFGLPPGTQGLSVGHGWVVLLHPLTPGTHTIVIKSAGSTITTTITVKPGH
jgi:hypothetical protein